MKTGAIEAKGDLRYLGLLVYRLYNYPVDSSLSRL